MRKLTDEERKISAEKRKAREKERYSIAENKARTKARVKEYQAKNKARIKEYQKEYYSRPEIKVKLKERRATPENKARMKERYDKLKLEIYTAYSNGNPNCACCGYDDIRFLQLDHIVSRKKMAKEFNKDAQILWKYLKDNNYPKGLFQVLCSNCNFAKRNNAECPHQTDKNNFNIAHHVELLCP